MPYLNLLKNLKKNFLLAFGDSDRIPQAERELLLLKQKGRSASALVSDFQRLAMEIKWSEEALFSLFYQALNEEVKDEICKCNRPDTIEEYYTLAIKIDNRLFERRQEKKTGFFQKPTPIVPTRNTSVTNPDAMIIGSTRSHGPLTQEERLHRKTNGLCMYCGSSEHFIDSCTLKPNKPLNSKARR
jgi:hypothetical protein